MADAYDLSYLSGLPEEKQAQLAKINAPGLARLSEIVAGGEGIAFLGAGTSAPLYPLWEGVIGELIETAADRLTDAEAATCREFATTNPDAVVDIIRQRLRPQLYWEVLREVFQVRCDPATGRTWTATHELIVRCNLRAVVTTNYDPGVVNARVRVRPLASATGFASWADELTLDRWYSGEEFGGAGELPVLFAHGHHNQPENIVLATTEYRRAYEGKLARVLGALVATGRLIWVGFSFADQRITAILREIADTFGTRADPGMAPRHVALMPWEQPGETGGEPLDPGILREICALQYASDVVLYPTRGSDHTSLRALLEQFADPRFPPPADPAPSVVGVGRPAPSADMDTTSDAESSSGDSVGPVVCWVHGGDPIEHFAGRVEELARLDRWAADPGVKLVGVTAWGGAGKTALVTEWLVGRRGAEHRPGVRGVFAWSFYENPSEEAWAQALLEWARQALGVTATGSRLGDRVVSLLQRVPLVVVLDGLELLQEGPDGADYGRLLGGLLRDVLTAICRIGHEGIALLTSRFPFADLERFDGGAARMLDVPPLSVEEGAELLARAGAAWIDEAQRRRLVSALDGHALAVGALAGALADRPASGDVDELLTQLEAMVRTNERVRHVLSFYAERLGDRDRALVAIVSLFQRPVKADTVLEMGASTVVEGTLTGWSTADVCTAVQQHLGGLLTWHADSTVSAHPLVRDSFRPLALTPESAQLAAELTLDGLPTGRVRSREDALRVVEIIELLLAADQWEAADELYIARTENAGAWKWLPAARMGQRCELAFVATPARRAACEQQLGLTRLGFHLSALVGSSQNAGDLSIADEYLPAVIEQRRAEGDMGNLAVNLSNLAGGLIWQGLTDRARDAAHEAQGSAHGDRRRETALYVLLARAWEMAGETAMAERDYLEADRIEYPDSGAQDHLYSLRGVWWANFLVRTGRPTAARRIADASLRIGIGYDWNEDVARAEWVLGCIDLVEDRIDSAGVHLRAAATTFRDGEYLCELATTLVDFAEQQRRGGQIESAEHMCNEAIEIAAPRGLVPTHAAALAVRACVRVDRDAGAGDQADLYRARDDADHALRLSTKVRQLAWEQLAALRAHAHIDQLEGRDHGWAERARAHHAALVPAGLDPDVLATVEAETPERSEEGDTSA